MKPSSDGRNRSPISSSSRYVRSDLVSAKMEFVASEASSRELEVAECTLSSHLLVAFCCMPRLAVFVFLPGLRRAADHLGERHQYDDERDRRAVHRLGGLARLASVANRRTDVGRQGRSSDPSSFAFLPSSDYGHLAERLCVMAGFVGTAIGLSLQAKSLAGGATSFTALATSLFTTASGGTAAALIAIMTFKLKQVSGGRSDEFL